MSKRSLLFTHLKSKKHKTTKNSKKIMSLSSLQININKYKERKKQEFLISMEDGYDATCIYNDLKKKENLSDVEVNNIGYCRFYGYGVHENKKSAFYLFKKKEHNKFAMFNLAKCYEFGYGCEKNIEQAIYYYTQCKLLESAPCLAYLYKRKNGCYELFEHYNKLATVCGYERKFPKSKQIFERMNKRFKFEHEWDF
jgi:TPR repeat protein